MFMQSLTMRFEMHVLMLIQELQNGYIDPSLVSICMNGRWRKDIVTICNFFFKECTHSLEENKK
jgi:hypothetical protein